MRRAQMKGTISAIVALAASVILLFAASSSLSVQENNETMTKMIGARETALKTENAIRLLDKATADHLFDNLDNQVSCKSTLVTEATVKASFDNVLGQFSKQGKASIRCAILDNAAPDFTVSLQAGKTLIVTGRLDCNTGISDWNAMDSRWFTFTKDADKNNSAPVPYCYVKDNVSGCNEQPIFSC